MNRINANTISTYIEGGIKVTVLKPSVRKNVIRFSTKHKGRTRTASDFAYMHRVARK